MTATCHQQVRRGPGAAEVDGEAVWTATFRNDPDSLADLGVEATARGGGASATSDPSASMDPSCDYPFDLDPVVRTGIPESPPRRRLGLYRSYEGRGTSLEPDRSAGTAARPRWPAASHNHQARDGQRCQYPSHHGPSVVARPVAGVATTPRRRYGRWASPACDPLPRLVCAQVGRANGLHAPVDRAGVLRCSCLYAVSNRVVIALMRHGLRPEIETRRRSRGRTVPSRL